MKIRSEATGSRNDDWASPDWVLDHVRQVFGEFFDPCPLGGADGPVDGLSIEWGPVNYINPPYTRKLKEAFIRKAYEESMKGKLCIMLIPAATDSAIFHDVIAPHAEVQLIRGRVRFKGYNTKGEYVTDCTGQSGSMFVIFGPHIKPSIFAINQPRQGVSP